jgi:hypothetical protein
VEDDGAQRVPRGIIHEFSRSTSTRSAFAPGTRRRRRRIPLIHCAPGVRKHELAEQHRPSDANFTGVFLIRWRNLRRGCGRSPRAVGCLISSGGRRGPMSTTPLSRHRQGLGPPHVQDQWPSAVRAAGHAQRSRVGRTARPEADHRRDQRGNCFVGGSDFQALADRGCLVRRARDRATAPGL